MIFLLTTKNSVFIFVVKLLPQLYSADVKFDNQTRISGTCGSIILTTKNSVLNNFMRFDLKKNGNINLIKSLKICWCGRQLLKFSINYLISDVLVAFLNDKKLGFKTIV